MPNFFEMPKKKKTILPSGLGRGEAMPSKRKTYIPYDSFMGDADLKLEPKTENLSGNLKKRIENGDYVPPEVLRGGISDETRSKILDVHENYLNSLDDRIDRDLNPKLYDEDPGGDGPYSKDEETRKIEKIEEQKDWEYNSEDDEKEAVPTEEIAVELDHGVEEDKLPSKKGILPRSFYSDKYHRKTYFGESHITDRITEAQRGRRVNEKLGKKLTEHMHEEHNKDVDRESEFRDEL